MLRIALVAFSIAFTTVSQAAVDWKPWREAQFAEAAASRRLILLELEAVWCHWCHVMEARTWSDPAVAALIGRHFIAVKVDQDSRPDLGKRFEEYGWPATIVFDGQGRELLKLRGFIEPARMLAILEGVVKDPSPREYIDDLRNNPAVSADARLGDELREELRGRFLRSHDQKLGGLSLQQKFLDRDSVELQLALAGEGDAATLAMARQTLDAAVALIDPAWGGAYQYSTDGDWQHPHFEKIMSVQAAYFRVYTAAWRETGEPRYRDAAAAIRRYVFNFLSRADGAFYVSQDADLVQGEHSEDYFKLDDGSRRALGLPRVDTHVYARENGWMIEALAAGDAIDIASAVRAAKVIERERGLPGGGFRHDAVDRAGPYLDDNLAMARAYLALYAATGERPWLTKSARTAAFIARNFRAPGGGFVVARAAGVVKPRPNLDENIQAARYFNLLSHHTGKPTWRQQAEHAMRYLATEEVATFRRTEPGILLADREMSTAPLHITVVGGKGDVSARELFAAARAHPANYRRIEWWDRAEGKLPNADVAYPRLKAAAAFICTNRTCSSPIYSADEILPAIQRIVRN